MIKIQKISLTDLTSGVRQVEITIADKPTPENATTYLTATLPVKRRGHSLESIEAAAIDTLIEILREVAPDQVKQKDERRLLSSFCEERRTRERELNTEIELENRRKDLVDTQASRARGASLRDSVIFQRRRMRSQYS